MTSPLVDQVERIMRSNPDVTTKTLAGWTGKTADAITLAIRRARRTDLRDALAENAVGWKCGSPSCTRCGTGRGRRSHKTKIAA